MKTILEQLFAHQALTYEQAKSTLLSIGEGACNPAQIASFLTVYKMRSIRVEELRGFRDALLALCTPVDLADHDPIDLCGTGGDNKDTFNISTLSAFVTAGAGVKVAKHGNYGVSSSCGSSNVMEYLGVQFAADQHGLEKQIEQSGICFLHAPLFHPAMKQVGPIRKDLAVKTFFNMLGPMVNPAQPKHQLVGVFSLELTRLYSYLYQSSEVQFSILHALDGYDEISLTGQFKQVTKEGEIVRNPEDIGMERVLPSELHGGSSIEASAKIFTDILEGKGTAAQNAVVCANAGTAIHTACPELTYEASIMLAKESLKNGRALESFKKLLAA